MLNGVCRGVQHKCIAQDKQTGATNGEHTYAGKSIFKAQRKSASQSRKAASAISHPSRQISGLSLVATQQRSRARSASRIAIYGEVSYYSSAPSTSQTSIACPVSCRQQASLPAIQLSIQLASSAGDDSSALVRLFAKDKLTVC